MIDIDKLDFNKNGDGLIPAVIQDDATLQVLMLGFMNREAYEKSVNEGVVTFFSRTKGRLWTKGETSGNFMKIRSVAVDCDNDTLLFRVEPIGPVCHAGTKSCFGTSETEGFLRFLERFIQQRRREMPEGSYTTKLFEAGISKISQKVGEEAVETVVDAVSGNDAGLIYEISDLVYHSLVLMAYKGISIETIEKELASRHK